MSEAFEEIQPAVSHKDRSPGAVSIFFGKASLEQVKDIVRNRSTSFPRQYPEDDKEESPGSVGKKAAFFDKFIRSSSLEKLVERSESHVKVSMNESSSSEEMKAPKTGADSEDSSYVSRSLDYLNAKKPTLKEATMAKPFSYFPASKTLGGIKVEGKESGHMCINKNETEHLTSNVAVQVEEDILKELSALEEDSGAASKHKHHAVHIQLQGHMNSELEDTSHMGNKESTHQRKTSLKPTKSPQSSLLMAKTRLSSSTAIGARKIKDVQSNKANGEPKIKVTIINATNCSNTHKAEPHIKKQGLPHERTSFSNLGRAHGHLLAPEKSHSLTKGPVRKGPHTRMAVSGNCKSLSTSSGKNLEVACNVSQIAEMKVSSSDTNGNLSEIRTHQQSLGQGLDLQHSEILEKEKHVTRIKELPQKPVFKKASVVPTHASRKPIKGKDSAAATGMPKNMDPKQLNGDLKPSKTSHSLTKKVGERELASKISDKPSSKTSIQGRAQAQEHEFHPPPASKLRPALKNVSLTSTGVHAVKIGSAR